METLANATARKALVCYVTPAFDRALQLYAHMAAGTIAANSSFPDVLRLSGKDAWNYDREDAVGVANAEPTYIEDADIDTRIERLVAASPRVQNDRYSANLAELAGSVTGTAEASMNTTPARGALSFRRVGEIDS